MALLQVENLTFRYPDAEKTALRNVSFSVRQGEFAVLCGLSGCGKSTLLRLVKREISPFGEKQGRVVYDGIDTEELDGRRACAEIGFVGQNPESQIVTDKVWHELSFGLESLGLSSDVIRSRVAETAAYFGIESWFERPTARLSGGQKQLLNLAGVTVMQPKILLLDEPTSQLDPIAASNFLTEIYRLNREFGLTVVLVEHRLDEVLPLCDRMIMLEGGSVVFDGSPKDSAEFFSSNTENPMKSALPSAARIFLELNGGGQCPLTVRSGHDFIASNFSNFVKRLEKDEETPKTEKILSLKKVRFRYEKEQPDVLKELDLDVHKGEHICLLGGNGAGKTTLLGILSGVLRPYGGKVIVQNSNLKKIDGKSLYRRNLTLLPQDPQTVFVKNTVKEELFETCRLMNLKSEQAETAVSEIAKLAEISDLLDRHPYDLSGGEQQKAALAKLLLLKPKIMLLDEPTKGLDAHGKNRLAEILKKLKSDGMTLVTVTHDPEFAAVSADRCALLFNGKIVSQDVPSAFFSKNTFYTTAASRITKGIFENAVTCDDAVKLCRLNGKKGDRCDE